jgi:predicted transposase YdaD
MPQTDQADYDSPWKDVIEAFFVEFMQFFFPRIYKQIDWSQGFVFLDKELQKITRDAAATRNTVDKLVKVFLLGGQEIWILVHIEVQGQRDPNFESRMFIYFYRIFERYRKPIVSLAIFTDESKTWQPSKYEQKLFGCELTLKYPTVKLLDYRAKMAQLERSTNPFALVVLAHLRALETKSAPKKRMNAKLQLIRLMRGRGYTKKQIADLLRFIDWVLTLPSYLEEELTITLDKEEAMKRKKYVTSWERIYEARGEVKGEVNTLRKNISETLSLRFGNLPESITAFTQSVEDAEYLQALFRRAVVCKSLDEFESQLGIAA